MCTAMDVIREKAGPLAALPPDATVLDAAHLMNDRRIGSVLVMAPPAEDPDDSAFGERDRVRAAMRSGDAAIDGELAHGQLLGIFTERDILRRVVARRRDPERTLLREVMTTPVACAAPHTTLDELRLVMRNRRIRHVPVADESGRVLGMISIGDLNKAEHAVQEQTIHYLEQYISVA